MRELFVISDLHLGGRPGRAAGERGFCINTHGAALAEFVGGVAARAARSSVGAVELVLNGDVVDFLAIEAEAGGAPRWRPFIEDADAALAAFEQVRAQEGAFFEALCTLLRAGGDLTLLLGNHDLELSLPKVRAALERALEVPRGGRLRFITDGQAYAVGDALIEHGNRYDGFNVVEHDLLRRCRSAMSRRLPLGSEARFEPPPGSLLVAEVMNPIKERYAFVDLLKPETEAVLPLLLALEPSLAGDIGRLWRLWRLRREAGRQAPREPGWPAGAGQIGTASASAFGSEAFAGDRAGAAAGGEPLRELLAARMPPAALERLLGLAQDAQAEMAAGAERIGVRETAAWAGSLLRLPVGDRPWAERRRILLDALRTLQNDESFSPDREQGTYLDTAARLCREGGFAVVVFGHTHLAKSIRINQGGGHYLNTGTWADLMQVPAAIFDPQETVAMAELDRFAAALRSNDLTPYLMHAPHYAHVVVGADGRVQQAALHRADQQRPEFL